jgi:hypothetical protein
VRNASRSTRSAIEQLKVFLINAMTASEGTKLNVAHVVYFFGRIWAKFGLEYF